MPTLRNRSCYISASPGSNLDALRSALHQRHIRIAVPDEHAFSSGWAFDISRLLSEVGLVIGVLTRERRSDWVLFELGLAWSAGRQVLLLAPPTGTLPVPFDLKGVLVVRTRLTNREAIGFALDQLLAAPARNIQVAARPLPLGGLGDRVDALLDEARGALAVGDSIRFEQVVERALRESQVEALSSQVAADRGVDLAVWSDALEPTMGNPLLIELKTRIIGKEDSRRAAAQLSKYVLSSGSQWGLLLYGEGPARQVVEQSMPPNVVAISLEELLMRMRREPFSVVVKDLRNRRVHGAFD